MTMLAIHDRRQAGLAVTLLLALLALGACGTMRSAGSDQARAPGVHFHNDIVVFSAVGGGSGSR
jgi:predicted small secreted protein